MKDEAMCGNEDCPAATRCDRTRFNREAVYPQTWTNFPGGLDCPGFGDADSFRKVGDVAAEIVGGIAR